MILVGNISLQLLFPNFLCKHFFTIIKALGIIFNNE